MKLGVNTVLFGGFDLETAFRGIAMAGFEGVELSAIPGMGEHLVVERWREVAPHVRRLSMEYGLSLTAIEQPSTDPQIMELAFQAAAEMGIPIVNCGPGVSGVIEGALQESIDALGVLARMAESHSVTVCVKAHVGLAIDNTPKTLQAMKAIDSANFGIDMDPSHIFRANEDPVEALRAVLPLVRHVHIRDCLGRGQGPGKPEMQTPGRGEIDLVGYLRVLSEYDYTGPVNLEIIGAKEYGLEQCVAIAAESRGYLRACFNGIAGEQGSGG